MIRSDMGEAALALAALGLPVFPCYTEDRRPAVEHGFYDASLVPARIKKWPWRDRLIGVSTGAPSGVAVLDIDVKAGKRGDDWLLSNLDRLLPARVHQTISGGCHLLYRHRAGVKNSVSVIAPGVDVRAEGGYIIWWPASGCRVIDDMPLDRLPPWPDSLIPPEPPKPIIKRSGRRVPDRFAVEALCNFVLDSTEGERNNRLFWASCRMGEMLHPRLLPSADAIAILIDAGTRVGLSEREAAATAISGLKEAGQ